MRWQFHSKKRTQCHQSRIDMNMFVLSSLLGDRDFQSEIRKQICFCWMDIVLFRSWLKKNWYLPKQVSDTPKHLQTNMLTGDFSSFLSGIPRNSDSPFGDQKHRKYRGCYDAELMITHVSIEKMTTLYSNPQKGQTHKIPPK